MLLIESALVLIILLLAFLVPAAGSSFFAPIERALAHLARRQRLAVITVGATALALRATVLPILPVPYPGVTDEFSYQLMADTFVHGRMTNPTHPLWVHFENVGVIHQPTYCSVYFPAQGTFMALGQLVAGHPFWGVWLSVGLMCAAICWMLQAWIPPFYALVGGLLAAIRLGAFSYWGNSYWGGAVAAIGGALVLGALPRVKRHARTRHALLMGTGLAILATSRPYEGLFLSIPVLLSLILWIWHRQVSAGHRVILRVALPIILTLAATFGFLLYYFWRTTGNPFLPPYIVIRAYTIEPSFPWLSLRPIPHYHHEILRRYYLGFNFTLFQLGQAHPVFSVIVKLLMLWFFFLGPLLSIPFLALGFTLPYGMALKDVSPRVRFLLIACGATLLAMMLPVFSNPHYAAPITGAIYALIMMATGRIRHWRFRQRPAGVLLIRSMFCAVVTLLLLRIANPVFHLPLVNSNRPQTWCSPWYQLLPRAEVENRLNALPGQHLVIVHFDSSQDPSEDILWINNSADIDHSRIVWAHDMGAQNQELIHYFADRHVWFLLPDQDPIRLSAYEVPSAPTTLVQ